VNKALPPISGIWCSGMWRLSDSFRRHTLVRARSRSRHRPALQGGTPPFVPFSRSNSQVFSFLRGVPHEKGSTAEEGSATRQILP
jgi:hypothetical protein